MSEFKVGDRLSHSWVIAEQTINCEHTYDAIRTKAREAIAELKGPNDPA